jgi:predicted nucleic acid-binding protein
MRSYSNGRDLADVLVSVLTQRRTAQGRSSQPAQASGPCPWAPVRGASSAGPVTTADIVRTAEIVRTYADLPLGAVDASVIAVAERLKLTDVATLDRRHVTVVRPKHAKALNLRP